MAKGPKIQINFTAHSWSFSGEPSPTVVAFIADIQTISKVILLQQGRRLKSIVFPRNQVKGRYLYLSVQKKLGIQLTEAMNKGVYRMKSNNRHYLH